MCADFNSDWQGGLEKASRVVDGTKGSADKAIQGYVELESNPQDSLKQMVEEVRAVREGGMSDADFPDLGFGLARDDVPSVRDLAEQLGKTGTYA